MSIEMYQVFEDYVIDKRELETGKTYVVPFYDCTEMYGSREPFVAVVRCIAKHIGGSAYVIPRYQTQEVDGTIIVPEHLISQEHFAGNFGMGNGLALAIANEAGQEGYFIVKQTGDSSASYC